MSGQQRSGGFNLDDYVTVAERIAQFYEQHPQGSLQTEVVELNETRVVMRAYAYRAADDDKPAVAHSALSIPGTTPYTRGSEIENAETSAVGRAIAFLGFDVKKSVASRDEIQSKRNDEPEPAPAVATFDESGEALTPKGVITRTGKVARGSGMHSDLEARQTPDGYRIGFRLELADNKAIAQVVCEGPIGTALYGIAGDTHNLKGKEVTVTGEAFEVKFPGRKPYYRLVVSAIRMDGPDGWSIPAPSKDDEAELDAIADKAFGAEPEPLGLVS